jgi:hypothetical protein
VRRSDRAAMADERHSAPLQSAGELKAVIEAEREGAPFVVYRDRPGEQQILSLGEGVERVTVGRGPGCEIWLDSDTEVFRAYTASSSELVTTGRSPTTVCRATAPTSTVSRPLHPSATRGPRPSGAGLFLCQTAGACSAVDRDRLTDAHAHEAMVAPDVLDAAALHLMVVLVMSVATAQRITVVGGRIGRRG